MNQTELVQEVLGIISRPDQIELIRSMVRASILKAHQRDYYYKDIVESGIKFGLQGLVQNFDPKMIFGNGFRKIKYIRKWLYDPTDVNFGQGGKILTPIEIEQIFDEFDDLRTDVYYMAGQLVQIRSVGGIEYCLAGAYILPDVSVDNVNSWICREYPYYIVHEAAASVLVKVGKEKEASTQKGLANEFYEIMIGESNNMPGA